MISFRQPSFGAADEARSSFGVASATLFEADRVAEAARFGNFVRFLQRFGFF